MFSQLCEGGNSFYMGLISGKVYRFRLMYVLDWLYFAQCLTCFFFINHLLCLCAWSSQMTLLEWLTFVLRSQTVILTVLLIWISFFLLMCVFVLQRLCLHWEILTMLLSQFPLTFCHIHNRIPCFIV